MTDDELRGCLPERLHDAAISKIAVGMSGAGVYRIEAAGETFVLKVANAEPGWTTRMRILRAAAEAGVAPRVVHVDEARRAIVSELVVDRSFPALVGTPATRAQGLALLGATLARTHALPMIEGATSRDPLEFLAEIFATLPAVPAFVAEAVARVRAEVPPPETHARVMSHNDVNPTNLVYDGERVLLLDWDAAGPNDPYYDLAAVALFLRMDVPACLALIAQHDGAAVAALPARFTYLRRVIGVLCGCAFLHVARTRGAAGETTSTLEATLPLADVYQRMRSGTLDPRTGDGQWTFGLALVKASGALP